jgi:lactoylglutathione lyase
MIAFHSFFSVKKGATHMNTSIAHVAIWVKNLDAMREFYESYFHCTANQKYINEATQFSSYFLTFSSGARLELMNHKKVTQCLSQAEPLGLSHLAIAVGSRKNVEKLTKQLQTAGFKIISEPRETGDGHYESVFLDPENNRVEITL